MSGRVQRPALIGIIVSAVCLFGVATAHASDLTDPAPRCEGRVIEQPFVPWHDDADYFLAPNGDFSAGGEGWELDGADVVDDNEPWYVHGQTGPGALRLQSGDSAVSPAVCVTRTDPTMRFFVRNTGGMLGSLRVEVLFEGPGGDVRSLPIGIVLGVTAGDEWAPAMPMPIIANLLSSSVAFRFTATGPGSSWRIDDLYIDPYGKG
jgi:hypothetical protein